MPKTPEPTPTPYSADGKRQPIANRVRMSDAAPQLPVLKKNELADDGVPFDIVQVGKFQGRYGESFRLTCVNDDGEKFLILMGSNEVRNDKLQAVSAVIATGQSVGPVKLVTVPIEGSNDTWELVDAE